MTGDFTEDDLMFACLTSRPGESAYLVSFLNDERIGKYGPALVQECDGRRGRDGQWEGGEYDPCACGAWLCAVTVDGRRVEVHGLEDERTAAREVRAHVRRLTRKDA